MRETFNNLLQLKEVMANLNASKKNIRRIATQTARNRTVKSTLKTLAKKVLLGSKNENKDALKSSAIEFVSLLDKAAKRSIIHPNKASRLKAKMAKYIVAA